MYPSLLALSLFWIPPLPQGDPGRPLSPSILTPTPLSRRLVSQDEITGMELAPLPSAQNSGRLGDGQCGSRDRIWGKKEMSSFYYFSRQRSPWQAKAVKTVPCFGREEEGVL